MCVFVTLFRVLKDCPLLILSNRDERRDRPTEPPSVHVVQPGEVRWLGGQDQVAGGTWLGLNEHGLIVAVTNRPKTDVPTGIRSRGLLCRELLASTNIDEAVDAAQRAISLHSFAGFNLLLLSSSKCVVIEAGDQPTTHLLAPGIHGIANRSLNDDSDPRTRRAVDEAKRRLNQTTDWKAWLELGEEICRLPVTPDRPGLCLTERGWGTVSSTIIALPDDRSQTCYRYAAGPPANVEYSDYSTAARELLTYRTERQPGAGSAKAISAPHRMHLRGPWEYVWDAESGRVKLPADFKTMFGDRTGTIRVRRRFGRPTNLEPHERVCIAFDGVGGSASVLVNGAIVGAIHDADETVRFDITDRLLASNQVEVELTLNGSSDPNRSTGLWGPVAIEVHRDGSAASG